MYNAVFYNGYHGNCNQILNASVVPEITTVHLLNYFTIHPPADPTLFNRPFYSLLLCNLAFEWQRG